MKGDERIPGETFQEWQFRVKPYITARNKWIDENVRWSDRTYFRGHK